MKGMRKIRRGQDFRGLLNYTLKNGRGRVIGGNLSGRSMDEWSSEFTAVRRLRPDIRKPVWHESLRLPAGETLSLHTWIRIGDDFMNRMGFTDGHPRLYILHDDPEGQHIHIVACRVAVDGGVYLGRNENLAATRHIADLEKQYALTITKGPSYDPRTGRVLPSDRKTLRKNEIEMALRLGREPKRLALQRIIDRVLDRPIPVTELCQRLINAGVQVIPRLDASDRILGFAFGLEGVFFPGSALGRTYGWSGLQRRGVSYEQARESQFLRRLQQAGGRYRRTAPADSERSAGGTEKSEGDARAMVCGHGRDRSPTSQPCGSARQVAERIPAAHATDSWIDQDGDLGSPSGMVRDRDDERDDRSVPIGNRSADIAVGTVANRDRSRDSATSVNLPQDDADQDVFDVPTLRM